MTETSERRHPFWQVQGVFDPDGNGGDFSYTIGLAERGMPELHIWGRPALGDDPGEDWKFSVQDMGRLLNELAWSWLEGDLRIGATFEREYDDGLVTVRFRVDEPQDSESLEAYGAHESPVVPIRWSLHRPPVGPAREMTAEQEAKAEETWNQLIGTLDRDRSAPPGWRVPDRPTWQLRQRWGPRTPLVLARAAQLWQADTLQLGGVVQVGLSVEQAGSLSYPCVVACTAARTVGRHRRVERLHDEVHRLVDGLGVRWSRAEFAAMELDVMGTHWTDEELRRNRSNLRDLIAHSLIPALVVEAVADVLPERTLVSGLGPFLSGLGLPGVAPDERWLASPAVLAVVRDLLGTTGPESLAALTAAHARAMAGGDYAEVFGWLTARAATGPACCPDVIDLLALDAPVRLGVALADRGLGLGILQEWATALTAALVHRLELSDGWCRTFTGPYAALLPRLRGVLDAPIVERG